MKLSLAWAAHLRTLTSRASPSELARLLRPRRARPARPGRSRRRLLAPVAHASAPRRRRRRAMQDSSTFMCHDESCPERAGAGAPRMSGQHQHAQRLAASAQNAEVGCERGRRAEPRSGGARPADPRGELGAAARIRHRSRLARVAVARPAFGAVDTSSPICRRSSTWEKSAQCCPLVRRSSHEAASTRRRRFALYRRPSCAAGGQSARVHILRALDPSRCSLNAASSCPSCIRRIAFTGPVTERQSSVGPPAPIDPL